MGRRGNKSHRVPNVKLRPAAPGMDASRPLMQEGSTCLAQETQDTTLMDPCPRPLKGVTLCATGIQDKPTLFKQAVELGATPMSAFTSRVTHLVAADHGGAKYWCAVERQIPILKPSWITENYQIWLRGDDVHFEESIRSHKLPIFSGVVLSFSGITDLKSQSEITRNLKQNDGVYHENLERPVRITHLLCSGGEETDKMHYSRKFNQRGEANIHLVWEEWFWDSLEFGGRFNEAEYNVQNPRRQRRKFIVEETPSPRSMIPESSSNRIGTQQQPSALDEDEEIACVAHRPAMTVQIWGSLLKTRGYEIMNGKVIRDPSKTQNPPLSLPHLDTTNRNPDPLDSNGMNIDAAKAKSIISTFQRANSFTPVDFSSQKNHSSQRAQPFRRTTSVADALSQPQRQATPFLGTDGNAEAGPSTTGLRGIFSGLRFRVLGEARSGSVRSAIENEGGTWASDKDMDEDVDYIVVRLVSGSKLYREEPDEPQKTKYRTECWLERCLSERAVCPYEGHITFLPLSIQLPVASTEDIVMCFSGLHQDEQFWLTRLLRALGIRQETAFSRRTTHLLCPSGTGLKYEKAREWGIPVVSVEWLAAIARMGSILPVSEYLVTPGAGETYDSAARNDSAIVDVKGKGKVIDADSTGKMDMMMNDITNGRLDQLRSITKGGNDNNANRSTQVSKRPSERHIPAPTQQPEPPDIGSISFGQPKGLLGGQPDQKMEAQDQGTTRPRTPSRKTCSRPQRSFILDLQLQGKEMVQPQIPSSKTPSPMKLPQGGSMASVVSLSPMKIDQALQESIISLLGKRQGEDEGGGRHGKRSRPQRRSISKQCSASSLNFDIRLGSEPDGMNGLGYFGEKFRDEFDSNSGMGEADPNGEALMDESDVQDKSTWVMYEDPGQADERERLMMLLRNPSEDGEVSDAKRGTET
ncbi:hypothetical protein AX15_003819 [Amanita polypyramis BW_CC]|nr:hypothetical protein AX15_003819 [Amanita polypyramis BW_CC]